MGHNDLAGLAYRGRNCVPVIGAKGAQINQLHAHALFALDLLRGLQSARDDRAISNHREVIALLHDFGFAKWDHVIRAGISVASIEFAVEALVLQEQHRIVATNGGA